MQLCRNSSDKNRCRAWGMQTSDAFWNWDYSKQPSHRPLEDQMANYVLIGVAKNALDAYNDASAACLRNVRRLLQVINVKFLFHDIHMRKLMTIFQILATLPVAIASPERSFSQLRNSENKHPKLIEGITAKRPRFTACALRQSTFR